MLPAKNSPLIAKYIISNSRPLTPLQINKLCFFSHGWYLGIHGQPLISETVEAWKYGPVIPSTYHMFKTNERKTVSFYDFYKHDLDESMFTDDEKDVMNQVIDFYSSINGGQLIGITHQKNSPWHQVYEEDKSYIPIPNDIIQEYYKEKYANLD